MPSCKSNGIPQENRRVSEFALGCRTTCIQHSEAFVPQGYSSYPRSREAGKRNRPNELRLIAKKRPLRRAAGGLFFFGRIQISKRFRKYVVSVAFQLADFDTWVGVVSHPVCRMPDQTALFGCWWYKSGSTELLGESFHFRDDSHGCRRIGWWADFSLLCCIAP